MRSIKLIVPTVFILKMRTYKFFILFFLVIQLAVSQDSKTKRIAVISGGDSDIVDIEEDAITSIIEEELLAMGIYNINKEARGSLFYTHISKEGSSIGKIVANLWRSSVDTLSPASGIHVKDSDVFLWNIDKSGGRTYSYDFRLYKVGVDYTATYTHLNQEIDKRYLKSKIRKTLELTGYFFS